ncbi:ferritin-like domain-containing protein, partial [Pseudomonas aeruginosa]
ARDTYFIHSRMYEDWGFSKLYERLKHEMQEETQNADALLRRILLLEGTPRMSPAAIHPGTTVPAMLDADLTLERPVRAALA